jgi:hypothetical protein
VLLQMLRKHLPYHSLLGSCLCVGIKFRGSSIELRSLINLI